MGITNSFFLGFICGGLIPVILGSWSVARSHRRDRVRGGVNPRLLVAGLSLSAAALVGLVASEGYTDKAVIPTRGDRPTVGFGSTFHENDTPVKMGDTTTPVRALIKAQAHIGKAEAAFRDSLGGVALHQGEYDLYVDWVYQYGMGAWLNSGMRRELLAGNYTAACDALLDYRKLTSARQEGPGRGGLHGMLGPRLAAQLTWREPRLTRCDAAPPH